MSDTRVIWYVEGPDQSISSILTIPSLFYQSNIFTYLLYYSVRHIYSLWPVFNQLATCSSLPPALSCTRLHCDRCRAGLVDAHSTNPVRHLLAFRLQLHGPEADRTNHRQLLRLFHLTPAVCRWSTHVVCTWIQLGRNFGHICHGHWPKYDWAHGDGRFSQWTIICIAKFDHLSFCSEIYHC